MTDMLSDENFIELPVIPLRGLVVFPNMVLHFDVGRKKSVAALKSAMKTNQKVFLTAQKDPSIEDPNFDDLYEIGTICIVKQMIHIPNSENIRVVVEGKQRGSLFAFAQVKPFLFGSVGILDYDEETDISKDEEKAYIRALKKEFGVYASLVPKLSNEVISNIISIDDSNELADFICSNAFFEYDDKQTILECNSPVIRIEKLLVLLKKENYTLKIEAEIEQKVQNAVDENQREYFLREQMKVISESLGDSDNPAEDAEDYKAKIEKLQASDEVKEKLTKEADKLMKMPSGSHEGTVQRNYLDKCLEIPFGVFSKDSVDLKKARDVLDRDHYSLDKVKERIIESLAVIKRNPDISGQILCLAGPPGVGKTSIVKSLANAMNRKYVRMALGGVHDEAEIRGHRKTYIGAMPGRIIESVIKSGVMNPIILLDEVDKLGNDIKGDPASALLEALDPEQNNSFADHYIEFPVDLSKVLFITTANDTSTIPEPLLDRMEVIELGSYTAEEKFYIAKKHLVKKEMKKHNLTTKQFKMTDSVINNLIEYYTREAGVRSLEKNIATLCRKASVALETGTECFRVSGKNLEDILGPKKYSDEKIPKKNKVGVVNGLAWTRVGGTLLPIEISSFDGTGKLIITGNLGDVMTESAKTAVGYVRSKVKELGINGEFYKNKDIHIHAPEGAIPKDGPSAGLAITTALVSELTGIPIKSTVAMTGEISLKGDALPIGGLKEKSMAAYKAGCDTVIIPKENVKDLAEISKEVKAGVEFVSVETFDEVLPVALSKKINTKKSLVHTAVSEQADIATQ